MKKILLLALLLTCYFQLSTAFGQSPEKMNYQAVIRNSSDQLVANTQVGMQISILNDSTTGTAVYVETQTPTTNANGLVSIEIGAGTVVSGDFTAIDWANGVYFLKTEVDPAGGTNYTISGIGQLLSVPYALHSKRAETIIGGINETDPVFGASVAGGITAIDTAYWNNKADSCGGQAQNVIFNDSLVLKDAQGIIRMVLNPNTGSFKMMDNDTVWYELSVNSPKKEIERLPGEGNYIEYEGNFYTRYENNEIVEISSESTTDDANGGIITTEESIFYLENGTSEEYIVQNTESVDGTETIGLQTIYDSQGNVQSSAEQIEIREYSLSGEELNQIVSKDATGNILTGQREQSYFDPTNGERVFKSFIWDNGGWQEVTQNIGSGLTVGDSTQNVSITKTAAGDGYTMGLNSNYNNDPKITLTNDTYGGYTSIQGESIGLNAPHVFTQNNLTVSNDATVHGNSTVSGNTNIGGNLNVTGTKNFRIDHPTDNTKYLQHAAIESNEVLNVYSGVVLSGADSIAIVILPDYFNDINTGTYRYQLTVTGGSFAQAIVYQEIDANNQFKIKTSQPNTKVSWEVTAKRNDAYMQNHPFQVIIDK